jgi:hypothetical protein
MRSTWSCLGRSRNTEDGKAQSSRSPNCSTMLLAIALGGVREFDVKRVIMTMLQPLSGAEYPGLASIWRCGECDSVDGRGRGHDRNGNAENSRTTRGSVYRSAPDDDKRRLVAFRFCTDTRKWFRWSLESRPNLRDARCFDSF